jgi:hypothetical protein
LGPSTERSILDQPVSHSVQTPAAPRRLSHPDRCSPFPPVPITITHFVTTTPNLPPSSKARFIPSCPLIPVPLSPVVPLAGPSARPTSPKPLLALPRTRCDPFFAARGVLSVPWAGFSRRPFSRPTPPLPTTPTCPLTTMSSSCAGRPPLSRAPRPPSPAPRPRPTTTRPTTTSTRTWTCRTSPAATASQTPPPRCSPRCRPSARAAASP